MTRMACSLEKGSIEEVSWEGRGIRSYLIMSLQYFRVKWARFMYFAVIASNAEMQS